MEANDIGAGHAGAGGNGAGERLEKPRIGASLTEGGDAIVVIPGGGQSAAEPRARVLGRRRAPLITQTRPIE